LEIKNAKEITIRRGGSGITYLLKFVAFDYLPLILSGFFLQISILLIITNEKLVNNNKIVIKTVFVN